MDTIGQRIKKYRLLKKWTQRELASRAGIHEITEQAYELGTRHPKAEYIEKIARALNIDVSYLYPSRTDTTDSIVGILYDLLDEYGNLIVKDVDGQFFFGVDNSDVNRKMSDIYEEYTRVESGEQSMGNFKIWLAQYPYNT